jgi:isopentenyldiphosphate isomerase
VCSHPLYSKEEMQEENQLGVKIAAKRKIDQELGISSLSDSDFKYLTRIHYKAPCDDIWGEHESKNFKLNFIYSLFSLKFFIAFFWILLIFSS